MPSLACPSAPAGARSPRSPEDDAADLGGAEAIDLSAGDPSVDTMELVDDEEILQAAGGGETRDGGRGTGKRAADEPAAAAQPKRAATGGGEH